MDRTGVTETALDGGDLIGCNIRRNLDVAFEGCVIAGAVCVGSITARWH